MGGRVLAHDGDVDMVVKQGLLWATGRECGISWLQHIHSHVDSIKSSFQGDLEITRVPKQTERFALT